MQITFRSWLVVFSAALFFFYEFIQMNMFSSLDPYLMQAFNIDATQLGQLSATYFYSTILFLLPAGQILDRYSTRKVILIALFICAAGTISFAYANTYWVAAICRFFTGIGSAFCFLSCVRLASRWFPNQHMALVTGLIVTMAMLGGTIAQTPLTLLINHFDWRQALVIDGLLGIFIFVLIFLVVKDYPANYAEKHINEQYALHNLGYWKSMRTSYLKLRNWLCGLYTCFLNLPIFLLGAIFGSLYLQQVKHLSALQASYPAMMIYIGTVIGSPLAGWISDKLKRRLLPMRIGAILTLSLLFFLIYTDTSLIGYAVLFFLLGLVSSSQIISYPTVAESSPRILTATSVSVVSFTTLSGGAIFQPLFGYIMDMSKDFQIINGVHVYSVADYHRAMWIMPITVIIALLATLFLRETYCKEVNGLSNDQ